MRKDRGGEMIGWVRRMMLQLQQFRIRLIVGRHRLKTIGVVYHVNYVKGSDSNDGSRDMPFKTISYALSQCKAGSNDMVVVRGEEEQCKS